MEKRITELVKEMVSEAAEGLLEDQKDVTLERLVPPSRPKKKKSDSSPTLEQQLIPPPPLEAVRVHGYRTGGDIVLRLTFPTLLEM